MSPPRSDLGRFDVRHCARMAEADRQLATKPVLIAKARDGAGDDQHYVDIRVQTVNK